VSCIGGRFGYGTNIVFVVTELGPESLDFWGYGCGSAAYGANRELTGGEFDLVVNGMLQTVFESIGTDSGKRWQPSNQAV
jgi:hypothetical protein